MTLFGKGSRRLHGLLVAVAVCLLVHALLCPLDAAAQDEIRIGGTGGMISAMGKIAEAFRNAHPSVAVKVMPSLGSTGGIKAVINGALDIGISSRPLNDREQGAQAREFARTPFVFATAVNNPVAAVTIRELADIYGGKTPTWPDGRPIRLVLRPSTEFDTLLLKSLSPDIDRAVTDALGRQGMIVAITDQDCATALEKVPGAFGTTTLGQIISEKRRIKTLSLNGVMPGPTVSTSVYPYFKTYFLITKPDPRPIVRQFIEFAFSPQTRDILTRSGYRMAR